MTNRDLMKMRRKGGFIAFIGVALLILSPVFLISGTFIPTIILVIIGCFLIFYGINYWKKSMHEMRVGHTAIHAGEGINNENVDNKNINTINKGKANKNIILMGLGSGFLGYILYQFIFSSGFRLYIRVAYLFADFLYLMIGGFIIGLICLFYFNLFGSPKKCFLFGLLYEIPAIIFYIFVIGWYWTNIPVILTPLAFISFGVLGYIAGYVGKSMTPISFKNEQRILNIKNPEKIKCPSCYAFISKDVKFCSECGENITTICSECNKVIPVNAKFCPKCGNKK